jgi:hypothetical protein
MTDATDLRIAVNRLSRTLRAQKADSSVTDAQFSALARLHRDGVTPPSMTKTVAVLVERGLVSKCGHGDDRRKVLLGATPAGAAFVEETRRRRDGWLSPRLAALTADERSTLADATEIMRRLAQQ